MKKLLAAVLVLAVTVSCTSSKRISQFVVPEINPTEPAIDLNAYQEKYGQYDGVYLYNETTMEHYGTKESGYNGIGASWTYIRMHREKLLVFDPEVDWMTSFRSYWKPDTMYVRITTPDGRVRSYGVDDLRKEKGLSDIEFYTMVYPDIVPGTIIEEGYEIRFSPGYYPPPLDYDIKLQFSIPCERIEVTFACPSWWGLAIKRLAADRAVPVVWKTDIPLDAKKQMFTYTRIDIPAVTKEPYAPFFKQVADYLQFQIMDLEMKGATYSQMNSWQDWSERFMKYLLKKRNKGWEEVQDRAQEITASCATDLERLDAVVAFVRDSIEQISGGYDGNYPKVLEKKRGSVIELCGLTQVMLKNLDIAATLLLVHSATEGFFDDRYISGDQFSAPAVRVKIAGDDYVVFPYIERLPINHVPSFFQGQTSLQLTGSAATVWMLPPGNRAENVTREEHDITITEAGTLLCRETLKVNGSDAYDLRETLRSLDSMQTEEIIREGLSYKTGDPAVDSFVIHDADVYNEPLVIDIFYTIDNLVTVTPDEVIFQTAGLFYPIDVEGLDRSPEERINPISIPYDTRYEKQIVVHFPQEWTIATALTDVTEENLFGSMAGKFVQHPGELVVSQQVSLTRALEPKEHIVELQKLIGNHTKLQMPAIVFSLPPAEES